MWIFLNDAFLSIVEKPVPRRGVLQVRARKKGHIEAVFGNVDVIKTPNADYLYRAFIPRKIVSEVIAQRLMELHYSNFKDSIPDDGYHDACAEVWSVMAEFQASD